MSLLDDASLVVVPSGYKAGTLYSVIPTDGSGDLSFTRSNDTATRVNSAGLIEKVRTNLFKYSEQFNLDWTKTGCTITANDTTAPDGTLSADRITVTSTAQLLNQSPTLTSGQPFVFSVFVKEGNWGIVRIGNASSATSGAWFNVTNGTAGTINGGTSEIIDYGNGWYRLIAKFTSFTTGTCFIGLSDADGSTTTSAIDTFMYIWGAQAEVSDFGATDYIPTTSAAVSVGMLANVPRLDYSGGGCPKLLLEPQRTNLVTYSEQFDNASWSKTASSVTANSTTSPSGVVDADTLTANGTSSRHDTFFAPLVTSGTNYTYSVYAKKGTNDFLQLSTGGGFGSNAFANFDLNTGVIGTIGSAATATITAFGNGWYRCTMTAPATITGVTGIYNLIVTSSTASRLESNTLTTSVFLWGAQLEAGSYATSYIPTLAAAVTRGADACFKTGISSLIGQTEGTLYWEGSIDGELSAFRRLVSLSDGTTNNAIYIQNPTSSTTIQYVVVVGGVIQINVQQVSAFTYGQQFKVAAAYKENDFVLYINGVQISSATSGSVPATSKFAFDRGNDTTAHEGDVAETILFPTRLTNDELASLTTL